VQLRVIHNLNQRQHIISLTDRVQLITEVQVQEHHQEVTAHLLQVQVPTEAVLHQQVVVAAAAITAVVGAAEEAVVVHIPVDPAVALQAAAVHVQEEVVHLHPVADNYRKH
jgi:hypothetical protein